MLTMPVDEIKKRIQEQSKLSETEINKKIQDKMKQLAGLISEEGACHIIANELGVQLIPDKEERSVKDLLPGMRDVEQDLKTIQVYELRTFTSKFGDGEGKVCSFLAGDKTGVIRITCWGSHADTASKLSPGDIVSIKNGYIKDNQGRAELHLNNNSELTVNPPGVQVETAQQTEEGSYTRKKINELSRGDYRVELLGTVVQAYEPRNFDKKDGSGQGAVMNLLLDDGTGSVRCALWGGTAAKALSTTEEQLVSGNGGTWDEERTALLGNIILVRGRAKLNTVYNSIELNTDELELNPNPEEELKKDDASETNATTQKTPATSDEQPPKTKEETPSEKPPTTLAESPEDPISLDELEDLDIE